MLRLFQKSALFATCWRYQTFCCPEKQEVWLIQLKLNKSAQNITLNHNFKKWAGSKSDLNRDFPKNHKNSIFSVKSYVNRYLQVEIGAGAETFRKSEPEPELKHSFGSATLDIFNIVNAAIINPFVKALLTFKILFNKQDLSLEHQRLSVRADKSVNV